MVKFLILGWGVGEFQGAAEVDAEAGFVAVVDGRWDRRSVAAIRILFRVRGLCGAGFIVKFLILERGVGEFQGAAKAGAEAGFVAVVNGRWDRRGFGAIRILVSVRGLGGTGFMVKFLISGWGVEEFQGSAEGGAEGGAGGAGAGASFGGNGSAGLVGAGGIDAFLGRHRGLQAACLRRG
jgi:hypothetical protein